MATEAEIAELRLKTDLPESDPPYTNEFLSALIDAQESVDGAAGVVWRHKAASYASLVDTSESGSSRKMSQLQENALRMASLADVDALAPSDLTGFAYTIPIERP